MASVSANENAAQRRDASASTVAEDDYQSFCEALGASARGRAFLEEYARRNRHADTEVVLEALGRLEETARSQRPPADADRIRQDLRALLDTLRTAKPQTENSPSAIKAATLSALIDFTQARLEALVTMPDELRALEALAAVPPPEQPELPIPQPVAAAPAPSVVLTQPPLRVAEAPVVETIAPPVPTAALADADSVGIPKVEFDYQAQQAARPTVTPQVKAPVEPAPAWSELSPPPVAAPKAEAKPELKVEQALETAAAPAAEPTLERARDVKIEAKVEPIETKVEPKLEPKAEATLAAKSEAKFESLPAVTAEVIAPSPEKPEAKLAPAPQSKGESGRIAHAGEVETYELWLDDLSVESTVTIAAEAVAPSPVAANPVASSPVLQSPAAPIASTPVTPIASLAATGLTATAIEALVEQLQRPTPPGAGPVKTGKAEVADPLAPILALSDDERLALFT